MSVARKPQKKYYRQRAHSNPIADHSFDYPVNPSKMDWSAYYPEARDKRVEFADVGCGYGGLLIKLGEVYPDVLSLGMEIRVKVSDYVMDRIRALRLENPGKYSNIACIRTNAMKYLPNFFSKGQLQKMFFLYPDPHFKKSKHKWRIVNPCLLAEYAYVLCEGARVYTVTDVSDLHDWMLLHFSQHPLFRRIPEDQLADDKIMPQLLDCSEEGQKVSRNNGSKFLSVFERVKDSGLENFKF